MPPARRRQPTDRQPKSGLFHWTASNGLKVELPSASTLDAGVLRENRNKEDLDFAFSVLEAAVSSKAQLATIDKIPATDLMSFFRAWMEEAGADAPQS